MMNRILTTLVLLALSTTGITQTISPKTVKGSGYVLTQQRSTPPFRAIEASGTVKVFVYQGPQQPLTVEADDNLFSYIITEVKKDTLRICIPDSVYIKKFADLNVMISTPNLSYLSATKGADIDGSTKPWNIKKLDINLSEAEIRWHITADTVNVSAENRSILKLKGNIRELSAGIRSGSQLDAKETVGKDATLILNSSSKAEANVTDHIIYRLMEKSILIYIGTPQVSSSYVSTDSKVINRK